MNLPTYLVSFELSLVYSFMKSFYKMYSSIVKYDWLYYIHSTLGLLIHKFKKSTKSRQHRQNVEPQQPEDFNTVQVRLTLLYDSLAILVHRTNFFHNVKSHYSSVSLVAEMFQNSCYLWSNGDGVHFGHLTTHVVTIYETSILLSNSKTHS